MKGGRRKSDTGLTKNQVRKIKEVDELARRANNEEPKRPAKLGDLADSRLREVAQRIAVGEGSWEDTSELWTHMAPVATEAEVEELQRYLWSLIEDERARQASAASL